jgi:hypothetical protein
MTTNVYATSNGSGVFSQQHAAKAHLLQGPGGLAAEIQDVRLDLLASLRPEIGLTIDEFDGPGASTVLVLSLIPKTRMGTVLVRKEILDGVVVASPTSTITFTGGVWVFTPTTAVNASSAAQITGSADLSVSTLYYQPANGQLPAVNGTLDGLTLILTVNGVANTLTFGQVVNPLNPPYISRTVINAPLTLLQVIQNAFPGLTATLSAATSPAYLVLTDNLKGTTQTIVVGAGTANTALGLTSPTTAAGTGHSYAVEYEYDGTKVSNATTSVPGAPPYVNNYQGP